MRAQPIDRAFPACSTTMRCRSSPSSEPAQVVASPIQRFVTGLIFIFRAPAGNLLCHPGSFSELLRGADADRPGATVVWSRWAVRPRSRCERYFLGEDGRSD